MLMELSLAYASKASQKKMPVDYLCQNTLNTLTKTKKRKLVPNLKVYFSHVCRSTSLLFIVLLQQLVNNPLTT